MPQENKFLLCLIYELKLKINQVVLWLTIKSGFLKSIIIIPFSGYGNSKQIFLVGRVLKNNHVGQSKPEDSVWNNVKKMVRRFRTVVIPGVKVEANFREQVYFAMTNEEGYFEFAIQLPPGTNEFQGREQIQLTLVDQVLRNQKEISSIAEVFIPKQEVSYGVISDIDDTIIPTGAMRLSEMLKTTFAKNAHSRVPFSGVSDLYKKLEKGKSGQDGNPFFYVSSSPWNLYDFLWELLHIHAIPVGPLMLRDIGLSRSELISGSHKTHKIKQIRKILDLFKGLSFLLIGDSGQNDAEIYLEIVREYPGRIMMVFIRDVDPSKHKYVTHKSEQMKALGVEMKLGNNAEKAAELLMEMGLIRE